MAVAVSVTIIDNEQSEFVVKGLLTLTGNYGTNSSHGDTMDLSQLGVPSNALPYWVEIQEQSPAGALPSANIYNYMFGTTQANGLLNVRTALGTEFTEGSAYGSPPFSVTGFQLAFRAVFPAFVDN